ncbi:glycosyltransferase [Candidatus Saccharibacteria bacterium]|nr:glycosyltransferase [Candidatus Saccharibacteria bacterium]
MKKIKLSILVPVYNVEKFLTLCLESIKNQSFKDFECLLINDGSTDNSLEILENFAKTDKRFKVINKKNSGYGASLNLGIKRAEGEYIGIVEPDDFIHRDFYQTLLSTDAEVIKTSFLDFYGKTWKTYPKKMFSEVRKDFPANGCKIEPKKNQRIFLVDPTVWSAVYKREYLLKNNIKFLETEGSSYQDIGFQFKAFLKAKKVFCLEKPLYYYRRDNENASVKSDGKIFAVKTESDENDRFIEDSPEFKDITSAVRFRNYNWNLNRLKLKSALKFAKIAKLDYKNSDFSANYFLKERHFRAHELKFSTKHPSLYVFLRPTFKLKNQFLQTLSKIKHGRKK